jgi:phosphoribosyl 1,2-cyclic phosphodiesterase
LRKPISIDHIMFKAFPVAHSRLAPAVGLRIRAERSCVVYVPDVAEIPDGPAVLRGIDVYIGDGATVRRSMVRRKGGTLIGHAPIATQLEWCDEAGVRQAIFTHCGSPIVRARAAETDVVIRQLGIEHGVEARIAHDGLQLRP